MYYGETWAFGPTIRYVTRLLQKIKFSSLDERVVESI